MPGFFFFLEGRGRVLVYLYEACPPVVSPHQHVLIARLADASKYEQRRRQLQRVYRGDVSGIVCPGAPRPPTEGAVTPSTGPVGRSLVLPLTLPALLVYLDT